MPIRLVCFDLGGVVIRICRSWEEGCAAAGVAVRDGELWADALPARRALILEHQTGRIDAPTFGARASAQVGGLYSPDEILAVHDAWMLGGYEGIPELVERLHAAGVETAALSNTSAEHWERILEFPAVRLMRHRHASHLLGLRKPDPEIYRAFEERTGHAGTEILFFDDLEENVAAARDAGWHATAVDPAGDPAARIAETLAEHGLMPAFHPPASS